MSITASHAILERLADQHRRVLSVWRALILLRAATFDIPAPQRRWSKLPASVEDVRPLLRQMERRGELRRLDPLNDLYQVTVPYAPTEPPHPYEILMELHPYAAIGYLSALELHSLTLERPRQVFALVPRTRALVKIPIGTEPRDWEGLERPEGRQTGRLAGVSVIWKQIATERFFGTGLYQPYGFLLRATTLERTLLDVLQSPELGGGFEGVLEAWGAAADTMDIDLLVTYVERFDIGVLRQRVGFLLEELDFSHPELDRWQSMAQRGGSSKLVAANPYASTYSKRWNLSINAPISTLTVAS